MAKNNASPLPSCAPGADNAREPSVRDASRRSLRAAVIATAAVGLAFPVWAHRPDGSIITEPASPSSSAVSSPALESTTTTEIVPLDAHRGVIREPGMPLSDLAMVPAVDVEPRTRRLPQVVAAERELPSDPLFDFTSAIPWPPVGTVSAGIDGVDVASIDGMQVDASASNANPSVPVAPAARISRLPAVEPAQRADAMVAATQDASSAPPGASASTAAPAKLASSASVQPPRDDGVPVEQRGATKPMRSLLANVSPIDSGLPTSLKPFVATAPPGVDGSPTALQHRAMQHLQQAESALRRRSPFIAAEQCQDALGCIAQSNQSSERRANAIAKLDEGLVALDELTDFLSHEDGSNPVVLARLIEAHSTTVLHDVDTVRLTAAQAADAYGQHARQRFADSVGSNPLSARILCTMAMAHREKNAHHHLASLWLLRAANDANPTDWYVANELGYALVQWGHFREAVPVLQRSLAVQPTQAAMSNLAAAHQQIGDVQAAESYRQQLVAAPPAAASPVTLLTPTDFARTAAPETYFAPQPLPTSPAPNSPALTPAPAAQEKTARLGFNIFR
jgi:hypothetical protein